MTGNALGMPPLSQFAAGRYTDEDAAEWLREAEETLRTQGAVAIAGYQCATCRDAKFVRVGELGEGSDLKQFTGADYPRMGRRTIPCPDCNAPAPLDLIARAEIPDTYTGMTFETFPVDAGKQAALEAVRAWCESPRDLLLIGQNGRGKTGLAVSAVRWLCEHGTAARFIPLVALLARVRGGFADDSADRHLEMFRRAPVVVLDDLAAARVTDWAKEQVTALIEERRVNARPTVITCDVDAAALLDDYGPRLVSRLREYQRITVGGGDMRGMR